MDLHDLRAFLAVSSNLHFGKAAREVNLSTSALSRTIQRLEEEVGERLFVRDKRAVELTPAGRALRRYARDLLDGWESFRASLADSRETLRGELSVYCSVAASYTVLAGLIGTFRRRHPGHPPARRDRRPGSRAGAGAGRTRGRGRGRPARDARPGSRLPHDRGLTPAVRRSDDRLRGSRPDGPVADPLGAGADDPHRHGSLAQAGGRVVSCPADQAEHLRRGVGPRGRRLHGAAGLRRRHRAAPRAGPLRAEGGGPGARRRARPSSPTSWGCAPTGAGSPRPW